MSDSGYPFERDLMQFEASKGSSVSIIDVKRILFRAIRYWYLIVLSLSLAFLGTWAINRYSTSIYSVKASILIKENQENVGAKLLYNNALVNPYRNFYNELYILKSLPLLSGVVKELGLDKRYFREGEIKTTEIYDNQLPFVTKIIKGSAKGLKINFEQLNQTEFSLELYDNAGSRNEKKSYSFGDTLHFKNASIIIELEDGAELSYLNKELTISFHNIEDIANAYVNRITASWQEQGASLVNLSINGPVVSKELAVLTELIKQYQQYDLDKKSQTAIRTIEFIDFQLKEISDSLKYFEREVESFKEKNVVTNLDAEAMRLYQQIEQFESALGQMKLKKNYFEYLVTYLNKDDQFNQVVPPSSVGVDDPVMTGLITQLIQLQTELSLNTQSQRTESVIVTRKRDQIKKIRKDILESVRSALEAQQINESFIEGRIKLVDDQLSKLPESERYLINLNRNYNLSENLYIFLMQKRAEAGISKASTTSDIIVVNPPRQIGGAISPQPVSNYGIAFGLGLLLPFLIFVILEVLDDCVQSKEDIEKVTNIPLIGGVGHNQNVENLIVNNKPKSGVAESFRSLRSNLNFFTEGKNKKIFLITSSISGEGKTFSTINLATVLAFSGKKTLIVGADMRKPRLFDDFKLKNDFGLSNVLSGQMSLEEVTQNTFVDNLYLISGGPVPPNPSELMMGEQMATFLKEALEKFDFIILDTPPIGLVTDAFILSKWADHILFLVRQNYTPKQAIKTVQELYENGKIKKVSILFNDIRKVGPGYGYGSGYGYGYGYGEYNRDNKDYGYYDD